MTAIFGVGSHHEILDRAGQVISHLFKLGPDVRPETGTFQIKRVKTLGQVGVSTLQLRDVAEFLNSLDTLRLGHPMTKECNSFRQGSEPELQTAMQAMSFHVFSP